jgi:putative lipase involved disintegration of autophagic bodies
MGVGNTEILPRRLLNRGNKMIWITGHSLGGALASSARPRRCL